MMSTAIGELTLSSIALCLILIAGTAATYLAVSAGSHSLLPTM